MTRWLKIFLLLCSVVLISLLSMATTWAVGPRITITEMAVTTKIVEGKPIDSVHRISSKSVKALYCFTRLTSESEEKTGIKHVWYRNGEKVAEYELPVKGENWRTSSRKTVDKYSSGDWRVDVLDSEGKVLKSVKFRMN